MNEWSIARLLSGLHDDISRRLATVRETLAHPGTKGDASERVWLELLQKYLPKRYQAEKAHVVDSKGIFSEQIDVVVFDRQYSPFIFNFEESLVIPAESVYAVFEAKQTINAQLVKYASEKVASVRRLYRTSLPIPHAGGTYPPTPLRPLCTSPCTGRGRQGSLTYAHCADWTQGADEQQRCPGHTLAPTDKNGPSPTGSRMDQARWQSYPAQCLHRGD